MKLIYPEVTILDEKKYTPQEFIELIGRVCYKSEEKITDESADKFIENIIKRGHESVLEHKNQIMIIPAESPFLRRYLILIAMLRNSGAQILLRATETSNEGFIISGNIRMWRDFYKALIAHGIVEELYAPAGHEPFFKDIPEVKYDYDANEVYFITNQELVMVNPKEAWTHSTASVRFIVDRGVSHELVRHRVASFSQESTRYVDYSGDCQFIVPYYFDEGMDAAKANWIHAMEVAEQEYKALRAANISPQWARSVLPNSTKTDIVMTQTLAWWNEFFKLRVDKAAHPQMREVAYPLYLDMKYQYPMMPWEVID